MKKNRTACFTIFCLILYVSVWGTAFAGGTPELIDTADPLPLSRVVLFSTGVGYFQRNGVVEGSGSIDLYFHIKDINDLLKSMILLDFDGGTINSVNYASREPAAQTLRSMSIDVASNPGIVSLLNQLRGESVSLSLHEHNGLGVAGTVIGIEQKINRNGRSSPHVNLYTSFGIRSIDIETIRTIGIKNLKLKKDFLEALDVLRESLKPDKKRVAIKFTGSGSRNVQVGYLLETPVWKTSYRLSLEKEDDHYLQGWAIVENTTDTKWENVSLTLVSGRPISFIMDLYRPVFQSRPTIALDIASALAPQSYEAEKRRAPPAPSASREAPSMKSSMMEETMDLDYSTGGYGGEQEIDLESGVTSSAQAARAGDFFQYVIKEPISLPGKETAMVPIITESIRGNRFSIYNAGSHPIHPFNAVKLKNSTGIDLMGGPVTVFSDGNYAGDARIRSLPAEAEQYISFSLDLNTMIESENPHIPDKLQTAGIKSGVLNVEMLSRNETVYSVFSGEGNRYSLLIEHPIISGWDLVSPSESEEETASFYRFLLLPEEFPGPLTVAVERIFQQKISLLNAGESTINHYLGISEVNDRVKRALRGILERREEVNEIKRLLKVREQKQNDIYREQSRIRENMERLAKSSDLYSRYERLLGEQEDELVLIIESIDALRRQSHEEQESLEKYILSLQVD